MVTEKVQENGKRKREEGKRKYDFIWKKKIDLIIYGFQDSDIVFFFLTGFLGNQTENDQYNFFFKFLLYLCFVEGKLVDINYQMTN